MSAVIGVRAAWCVASVGRTPPNPAYANDINEQNDRDFELAEGESSKPSTSTVCEAEAAEASASDDDRVS